MKVRIRFAAEVFVEGENIKEVSEKWHALPIFTDEAVEENGADFVEVESVEDSDTYEQIEEVYLF